MKAMENLNKHILHAIMDGYILTAVSGKIVDVNSSYINMIGYTEEELKQMNIGSLENDINDIHIDHHYQNILQYGKALFETKQQRKDGRILDLEVSAIVIGQGKGEPFIALFVRDITQRKDAENTIRESQQLLASINQNIKEGIYRSTPDEGLMYVNKAFAKMFGYCSQKEVLEADSLDLYEFPSQRKELGDRLEKEKSYDNVEVLFKRKDGKKFWGLMSSMLTEDENGKIIYDGAIRDITEIKLGEEHLRRLNSELFNRNKTLARKEEELASSNKLLKSKQNDLKVALKVLSERNFELDQLVYKTSHDLRSPLRSILGLVNIIKIEEDFGRKLDYVERIEERVFKLDGFITSMLNYSRTSRIQVERGEIDFNGLIDNCIADLAYLENFNRMKIQVDVQGNSPFYNDPLRLQIIFSNIISNAYKYMDLQKKNNFLQIDVEAQADKANIIFRDNGIGIEQEYLNKVFDMFFRASEASDGSGLGLYIVKQSVEKLDGEINIASPKGRGTEINITLPQIKRPIPVSV